MTAARTPVIYKSIFVECDADTAFRVWVEEIATWWPVVPASWSGEGAVVALEGHEGGRAGHQQVAAGQPRSWSVPDTGGVRVSAHDELLRSVGHAPIESHRAPRDH